jgi:hypothetical protein
VRFIIGNLKLKLTDAINHCSHVFEIFFYSQYVDFKCIHQNLCVYLFYETGPAEKEWDNVRGGQGGVMLIYVQDSNVK